MDANPALAVASRLGGQGGPGTFLGMSPWGVIASLVFSGIGYLYIRRGRYEADATRIGCGIALMVYPIFVPNALYIVLIGAALMALPYILERL